MTSTLILLGQIVIFGVINLYLVTRLGKLFTKLEDKVWTSILLGYIFVSILFNFWLGRSSRFSNVEKYKEKWNPTFYESCETIGSMNHGEVEFQENLNGPLRVKFAQTWRVLPKPITHLLNSSVRKYIP